MKRWIALLLAAVMLLTLAACGSSPASPLMKETQTMEMGEMSFQIPLGSHCEFLMEDLLLANWQEDTYLEVASQEDPSGKSAWDWAEEIMAEKKSQDIPCEVLGKKNQDYSLYESWEGGELYDGGHTYHGIWKSGEMVYGFSFSCAPSEENEEIFRDILNTVTFRQESESNEKESLLKEKKEYTLDILTISLPKDSQETARNDKKRSIELEWEGTTFSAICYGNSPLGSARDHLKAYRREELKASAHCSDILETSQGHGYYTYQFAVSTWEMMYACKAFVEAPNGIWKFEMISGPEDPQEELFREILDSLVFEGAEPEEPEDAAQWEEPVQPKPVENPTAVDLMEYVEYAYPSKEAPLVTLYAPPGLEELMEEDWCTFQLIKQKFLFVTAHQDQYTYETEGDHSLYFSNMAKEYINKYDGYQYGKKMTKEPYHNMDHSGSPYSAVEINNTQDAVPYYEYIIFTGNAEDFWRFTFRVFLDEDGNPLCNWRAIADSIRFNP